jgi:hypothetical protein
VPVESSLYIVTMLLGIFFAVCEALIWIIHDSF